MTTYLLDINLLLALSDPMHIHHEVSHAWFAQTGHLAWATCPITENGFVRIASHPRYPNRPGEVPVAFAFLRQFCTLKGHQFWSEDITLRDLLGANSLITHAQITDVYLLGLALVKGGKLATLDQHIPVEAIRGGKDGLEMVPA